MKQFWQEQILDKVQHCVDKAINALADFLVHAATYLKKEPLAKGARQKDVEKRIREEFHKIFLEKTATLSSDVTASFPILISPQGSEPGIGQKGDDPKMKDRPGPFGDKWWKSAGRGAIIGGLIGLAVEASAVVLAAVVLAAAVLAAAPAEVGR